ncbi:MAG: serine/threonine protein kinase [Archangium sp.]|nr:serine/threonine protein kinase [Archangium sp.]
MPSSELATVDPLLGARLGEYEVLELIGEGGMGVVYRGVQPIIKKRVAIKVLKPFAAAHAQSLIDEAEAVNSIRHRSIIDIFSLGRLPDGRNYIVMEFLEGQPLDLYAAEHGLNFADTLSLLISLCSPLAAAHRAGVVHRDLKPSNVFLCLGSDGERYLKLLDFGIAKKNATTKNASARDEVTRQTRIMGTPDFMAPEQARGEYIGPETDVYALGVMAFQLFTGRLPFKGDTPFDTMMAHNSEPIPSVRASAPTIPVALEKLITRMLAKSPADRVQTVDEVRTELVAISREAGQGTQVFGPGATLADTSSSTGPRAKVQLTVDHTLMSGPTLVTGEREQFRSPRLVPVLGIIVALLVGGVVVSFLTPAPPAPAPTPIAQTPAPAVQPPAPALPAPAPPEPVVAVEPDAPVAAPALVAKKNEAPSQNALMQRVERFEAALAKKGEEADPAAEVLLRKYRVEATMLDTAADRSRFAKTLDDFERSFLKRRR